MKYTQERAQRVLEAISAGATRKAAAGHAGIDERTLYRWLERHVSFASLLRAREDDVEVRACAVIQQAALDDWRAAAWWLERRRADEYGRRDKVDLDLYIRQRAGEMGLDVDDALHAVLPRLRLLGGS